MNGRLEALLGHPALWRGLGRSQPGTGLPTGFRALDAALPGGGWPQAGLVELQIPAPGIGEVALLRPALQALCAPDQSPRWIAWLAPPHLPYAPALAAAGLEPARMLVVRPRAGRERLWAMEQALRSGACAAVLGWADTADDRSLRRLKLAAGEGDSLACLFLPRHGAPVASPADLRLALTPRDGVLDVTVLKCRGGRPTRIRGLCTH